MKTVKIHREIGQISVFYAAYCKNIFHLAISLFIRTNWRVKHFSKLTIGTTERLTCINDTQREHCVLLNLVQEFTEIEAWLLLTFFLRLRNQLISIQSIVTHTKEYRCLKNVIHQIDRNEWLLLSAFQKGLRQNLSWFLS